MQISLISPRPATTLFSDYVQDWSLVRDFYSTDYSFESIRRFSLERPPLSSAHCRQLCSILSEQQSRFGAGHSGVEKLASGAVAVLTGQQPVLFTGPLFSIYKAISAIQLSRQLERSGVPAVPVFWVAAEDHDFEEIQSTWILDRESRLRRIAVDLSGTEPSPAGWLEFREDIRNAVTECLECLPQSEFIPEVKTLLEDCYSPGVSPVTAFGKMMARLFAGTELIFVDPLHDGLKALAQPVIELAIRKNEEMRSDLVSRNGFLAGAGYHEQVKVDGNFTGLFAYRARSRQVLRPEELKAGVPWSPNVLLRPVVQDTLFPTAAYVGGPAEVAYFAQASSVYKTLGVPMPPIVPRISATLVEPRIARAAEKYGIEIDDVFKGKDFLKRKAVGAIQGDDLFEQVRSQIDDHLESLRAALSAVDGTLIGALDNSRQKISHQIESLRGKYVNAAARRDETVERHLDALCNSLFPEKKPQERVVGIVSFLARYGPVLIERLLEGLKLETGKHQVVEI